jgi:GT2 family glycosyltransferase
MVTPFISVVMATYNRGTTLEQGLEAVLNQNYPRDGYEVIIVDDASSDSTPDLLERWQDAYPGRLRCLRQQENQGPAAARNQGVATAQGTLIAFTDDDCIVAPDWLEQIRRGYDEPDIAGVGGQVLPHETDTTIQRYYDQYSPIAQPGMKDGVVRRIVTANASFRRDALLEVGGFDEQVRYAGGEDPDLCFRLRTLGYRLRYNPAAMVYHQYATSWQSFLRTYYRYGLGAAFFSMRHTELVEVESHAWLLRRAGWFLGMLLYPYRLWQHHREGTRGVDLLGFPLLDGLLALSYGTGMMRGYVVHGRPAREK